MHGGPVSPPRSLFSIEEAILASGTFSNRGVFKPLMVSTMHGGLLASSPMGPLA